MDCSRNVATHVARRVGAVPSYVRGARTNHSKRLAVIIGLGESMIVGQASNSTGLPSAYPPATGLYKFTDSGVFTALTEPNDDPGARPVWTAVVDPGGSYGHGYASVVAWRIAKLLSTGYEVIYVPCGLSGTTSWDWRVGGKLLADAIEKGRVALTLPNAELACILIDQGVNDCGVPTDPDGLTWSLRWTRALTKARGAWGATSAVKNVFRRLPTTIPGGYDTTKWNNLRTEQASYASSLNLVVDGYDGGYVGGGPHYAATGNEIMSRRSYENVKASLPQRLPTLSGRRGFSGWPSGTTVLGTATTLGTYGTASGGALLLLMRKNSTGAGVQILGVQATGNTGFTLRSNGATLQGILGVSSTSVTAPTRNWVAGDNNKLHLICLTWDATNVYLYFDRAQVGTSTPLGGASYTVATGRSLCFMSNDAGTSNNTDSVFLDASVRNSFLSLVDYQLLCDQTKSAGYITPGAISLDQTWQFPLESSAPDYIPSLASTKHDLEFLQGSEANVTHETIDLGTAVWGW